MAVPAVGVTQFDGIHFNNFQGTVVGTGAPQNVAHGLGQVPDAVIWGASGGPNGTDYTVVEGAHDATNLVFTITATVEIKVLAF